MNSRTPCVLAALLLLTSLSQATNQRLMAWIPPGEIAIGNPTDGPELKLLIEMSWPPRRLANRK